MSANRPKRIVVGVDGSDQSLAALEWAIELARPMGAEVVAVYAVPPPSYVGLAYDAVPPPLDLEWRDAMRAEFEDEWCRRLRESGVPYQLVMEDGYPASVIADVAQTEDAELVVVGRRGRSGVAELLLGSVSRELSHHCHRPVMLVSGARRPG